MNAGSNTLGPQLYETPLDAVYKFIVPKEEKS